MVYMCAQAEKMTTRMNSQMDGILVGLDVNECCSPRVLTEPKVLTDMSPSLGL